MALKLMNPAQVKVFDPSLFPLAIAPEISLEDQKRTP
jgi:hypothetical protein